MVELLTNDNFEQATSEGVVLIDMFASWCGPCKMVAPLLDELSNEIKYAKIVKVDVDASPELGAQFQVRSIPTFILMKDGEMIEKIVGANMTKEFYSKLIESAK